MASNYNFSDFFKNNSFNEFFKNSFDFSQLMSTQRRNIEALSELTQASVEGAQEISRRQAEIARANVENVLKVSKDMMTGGSPEASIGKQAELAKAVFENALSNLRETSETVMKSGFEAFDVINRRVAESIEEIGAASGSYPSSSNKKKSA